MTAAWALVVWAALGQGDPGEMPQVTDPRLKIELFAEAPQIVTPVGLAVDSRGRVVVVESHTHFPPPDYRGPKGDRIQVLEDSDGDGKADKVSTLFEGLKATMNVAFHPEGPLYVATRSEILRLKDVDGDGRAEVHESLVKLETPGNYPHNGLSGFAFDFAGNVYFGMGENLGAEYRLVGADGGALVGGGEGGNVYRCNRDGGGLQRVATGFWNPFHLAFDAFGRLFTVDNDPDSRPPCRFIHVVPGGDYGYRFRNGRRGTHPFTAWNGELPGTLPMAGGTGEAPSGLLVYESTQWPAEYRGDVLVTSWGDHRIDRFRLRPRGASFSADSTPVVVGGDQFRPVGVAIAPDGSIYVSDWVDKSYQLHGKGRIWRLSAVKAAEAETADDRWGDLVSRDRRRREIAARNELAAGTRGAGRLQELIDARKAKEGDDPRIRSTALEALASLNNRLDPKSRKMLVEQFSVDPVADLRAVALELLGGAPAVRAAAEVDPAPQVRAAALRVAVGEPSADELARWWRAQRDADPFIRQAAAESLARAGLKDFETQWQKREHESERLALALLVRRLLAKEGQRLIPQMLQDADPAVRFVAVQWIGEESLTAYRDPLTETLHKRADSRLLFESCLAALERLDGVNRKPTDEVPGEQYVLRLLVDEKTPAEVRRRALRTLRPEHPGLTLELLKKQLASDDAALRIEAVRSLRDHPASGKVDLLLALSRDAARSDRERAEAVMGLDPADQDHPQARQRLLELAESGDGVVAIEALRSLRGASLEEVEWKRMTGASPKKSVAWRELLERVRSPRPTASAERGRTEYWLAKLEGNADPEAGERIFFHPRATGCYRCHEFDGRGAGIGPELTRATRTLEKRRLVESLVEPSREVAPQFVPWSIETHGGEVFTGLLFAEEIDGTQRYIDSSTRVRRIKPAEIERRQPLERSIMPDGLPDLLTEQEFRDLVAFLRQAR